MTPSNPPDPWEALRALRPGERVTLSDGRGQSWTGTIVPRHDLSGDRILPLKLESGYNVGVYISRGFTFRLLAPPGGARPQEGPTETGSAAPVAVTFEPWVALLTTGGTIASRVDYETGGVRPVRGESEILDFYPELGKAGPVRIVPVFDRLSEDLGPTDWMTLAEHVARAFRDGARGAVIAHGTDTLGFTAAALSFLLADLPGPVVLVGAQRSPDRPSSDGASNLAAAVTAARDPRLGEVVVVMHAGLSDDAFAIHRGTRVRKMHSSRRDAFRTRNGPPLGTIRASTVELHTAVRPPVAGPIRLDGPLDLRGGLLWSYPGLTAEQTRAFTRGLRGVVLAGTGLGHVSSELVDWSREAVSGGMIVAMTTQCLEGTADPYVYATGRELLRAGVVYLEDMIPETAYAKMLWALGHADTPAAAVSLLKQDRAGEFGERRLPTDAS